MILGASDLQLPAYLEARKMGLHTIGVDIDQNAPALCCADKPLIISTIDTKRILEAAEKYSIDGIMTLASDMPIRSVAKVAKELNLVGISEETALNATDKYKMRVCLKNAGVPIPKFYKVNSWKEYVRALENFKEECIVKPTDNSGSRGIYVIENIHDYEQIKKAYEYSKSYSRKGWILVEEFMRGEEVSVEALTYDGKTDIIQVTDKKTTGIPYFVEVGHSQPSRHTTKEIEAIKSVTKRAVKAVGIDNGPSHTEIKLTKEGAKIVELGARLGGGNITTHLVPLSTGVNMVKACINLALGKKNYPRQTLNRASAIKFLVGKEGTLRAINNIERAKEIPGICEINITKHVGENVHDPINGSERLGYVISSADTVTEAEKICQIASDMIELEIV